MVLDAYDATDLVGLKVVARHAAIAHQDEGTIEIPKLDELMASAAVSRCLMPQRLRGNEIRAMRKIMGMTLAERAERMDGRAAVATVSRWESEAQAMGGYAEKVLRLLVCETLHDKAPGVAYAASMISSLRQIHPWREDPHYELPALKLELNKTRLDSQIATAWMAQAA